MNIISKTPDLEPFQLFGWAHILTVLVMGIMLFLSFRKYKDHTFYKYGVIISLIVLDVGYRLWAGFYEKPNYISMYSVHISSASVILAVWCLIKFNQRVFDVLFYWGLIFVPQAIITPGIVKYGFPHVRFFHIFLIHYMVIVAIVYLVKIEKRRLSQSHLLHVIVATHLYAGFVWLINHQYGTNYMFINRAGNFPSLLRYLGEYPYYLISLDIMMIVLFVVLNRVYHKWLRRFDESI